MKFIVRMTRQRKIILDEIRSMHTHPTADELYMKVKDSLPKISLGTIYRNIDILHKEGLILKLETGGTQLRVDGTITPHWHILCENCGAIEDIKPIENIVLKKHVFENTNYQYVSHQMDVKGICPSCQINSHQEVI